MPEQKTKIRKSFNYLIRAAIIFITYGFIYRQVFAKGKIQDFRDIYSGIAEDVNSLFLISAVFVLMLINWGIESVKWKLLVAKIEKISFIRAFEAVMTGVSISIFTPNRTGDYMGRVFILEKGNHIEGIFLTMIGSLSQIIVILSVGLFGFLAFTSDYLMASYQIREYLLMSMILLVPSLVFLIILFYFKIGFISEIMSRYIPVKWERFISYTQVFAKFRGNELLSVLLLSFIRYLVFCSQFLLLLKLFGVGLPLEQGIILIPVIYLVMTVIPSVALIDVGIRGSVALFIIGMYFKKYGSGTSVNDLAVVTTSTVLWFVNLIIPAILGTFFVFSLKFFRK